MREQSWDCRFLSKMHKGNLIDKISSYGFEVYVLKNSSESSSPSSWEHDALETKKSIHSETIDWLVVITILDERWEKSFDLC